MTNNPADQREQMAPDPNAAEAVVAKAKDSDWHGTQGEQLLSDLAHSFWNASGFLRHNDVRLEVQAGEVVLCGTVTSWYEKQLAQETLREVSNAVPIRNLIDVQPRLAAPGRKPRQSERDRLPKELVQQSARA